LHRISGGQLAQTLLDSAVDLYLDLGDMEFLGERSSPPFEFAVNELRENRPAFRLTEDVGGDLVGEVRVEAPIQFMPLQGAQFIQEPVRGHKGVVALGELLDCSQAIGRSDAWIFAERDGFEYGAKVVIHSQSPFDTTRQPPLR
jgi:hypothetical protein